MQVHGYWVDGVRLLFAEATHWRRSRSFTTASVVSKMRTRSSDPTKRVTEMRVTEMRVTPPLLSSCDPSPGSSHEVECLALGRRYLPYFSLWLHPALSVKPLQVSWLSSLALVLLTAHLPWCNTLYCSS